MQQKINRKKSMVDFIVAAVEDRSLGVEFARNLKSQTKAKEILAYLHGLGYVGITIENCEQILGIVNKYGKAGEDPLQ
ncbi:MAG: hypothetical protein C4576_05045 [Desulfobacteraceae bacterium]|nr:MAG: hypothetical protein C4576_05045 [Desulfobacteraceae bacterium]